MVRDKKGLGGTLDNDMFSRALLAYSNTPDRDTNRLPAQVHFGRQVRDFIPIYNGKYQPRRDWLMIQDEPERALRRRHLLKGEELTFGTQVLTPLAFGTVVCF